MTNRKRKQVKHALLLSCMLMGASGYASATDVWDRSGSDGNLGTDNELIHGSDQVHDLQQIGGVADQDWFLLSQAPYSSYEVMVDGLTEELASIPSISSDDDLGFHEVDGAGTIITTSQGISAIGSSRSLRVRNGTGAAVSNHYVRVMSAVDGCTTTCTQDAQYRIRLRETTLMIPRFNNSGTQITVLIMQNGSQSFVNGTARFWATNGNLLASQPFLMFPHGGLVLNTATVSGAGGASGMMTVDHDGRYGEVTGKAVALEPATGFSFDTPAVPRSF